MFTDFYTGVPENKDDTRWLNIYPNPGTEFIIEFETDESTRVNVGVFDISGRPVARVHDGVLDGGKQVFHWSARLAGLSRGMYFLRVNAGNDNAVSWIVVQ